MARKATDSVTLIGIDISRNGFDLIALDGRSGSKPAVCRASSERPLSDLKADVALTCYEWPLLADSCRSHLIKPND